MIAVVSTALLIAHRIVDSRPVAARSGATTPADWQLEIRRANQITKQTCELRWRGPDGGQTDFNPLVVRNVIYGRGPNGSFVALDAATGKQIWIHEGVRLTSRGVNYWSQDGKDPSVFTTNILRTMLTQESRLRVSGPMAGGSRVGLDRDPTTINQQTHAGASSSTCHHQITTNESADRHERR
jgi:hypothetical protein